MVVICTCRIVPVFGILGKFISLKIQYFNAISVIRSASVLFIGRILQYITEFQNHLYSHQKNLENWGKMIHITYIIRVKIEIFIPNIRQKLQNRWFHVLMGWFFRNWGLTSSGRSKLKWKDLSSVTYLLVKMSLLHATSHGTLLLYKKVTQQHHHEFDKELSSYHQWICIQYHSNVLLYHCPHLFMEGTKEISSAERCQLKNLVSFCVTCSPYTWNGNF